MLEGPLTQEDVTRRLNAIESVTDDHEERLRNVEDWRASHKAEAAMKITQYDAFQTDIKQVISELNKHMRRVESNMLLLFFAIILLTLVGRDGLLDVIKMKLFAIP